MPGCGHEGTTTPYRCPNRPKPTGPSPQPRRIACRVRKTWSDRQTLPACTSFFALLATDVRPLEFDPVPFMDEAQCTTDRRPPSANPLPHRFIPILPTQFRNPARPPRMVAIRLLAAAFPYTSDMFATLANAAAGGAAGAPPTGPSGPMLLIMLVIGLLLGMLLIIALMISLRRNGQLGTSSRRPSRSTAKADGDPDSPDDAWSEAGRRTKPLDLPDTDDRPT